MTQSTPSLVPRVLSTDGLVLRPFVEADEPAVAEAFHDRGILHWAVGRAVAGAPEAERAGMWLRLRILSWETGSAAFAVTDASDGTLLGSVGVRDVNRLPDQAVLGYWVTPKARGRGVATRALDAASRWSFAAPEKGGLGLHRLSLDHALLNPASCRVATKAGFRLEGTMRDFYVDADGQRHDSHLHARLATDRRPGAVTAAAP
ncbi:GNAT family protein [Streptomyces sp. NPDC002896]|uniref:GNAT family N-acetyltransferase n=1 Tax=Streptomyces sp. NPDC002896 TaxID=3154438 RepID=UPI00331D6E04